MTSSRALSRMRGKRGGGGKGAGEKREKKREEKAEEEQEGRLPPQQLLPGGRGRTWTCLDLVRAAWETQQHLHPPRTQNKPWRML